MNHRENYIRCMQNAAQALAYLRWARRQGRAHSINWALGDIKFWNRQAAFWRRLEKEVEGKYSRPGASIIS